MKFKFYNDPGHGWLAVSRALLNKLGIANRISAFSYQKGDMVYLEEDCDARIFILAYEEDFKVKPVLVDRHTNCQSRIRSYASYTKGTNGSN